ncbi:MAG: hypothetical protein KAI43_08105 [Candidatus Aureabacteria bacterium]|nr:hypothetical protein [Candidatus Auribacterota bacterium]
MKRKSLLSLFTVLFFFVSGCAPLLIGLGALGGYAISPDTVEGIYEAKQSEAFRISKDIMMEWTTDLLEDEAETELIGTLDKKRIWVFTEQLDNKTVRIRVKGRKFGLSDVNRINTYPLPDIKTAQNIFEKIVTPIHKRKR